MVYSRQFLLSFVGSLLAIGTTAHPGHDAKAEMAERSAYMNQIGRRSLSSCVDTLKERGLYERAGLRRRAAAEKLRKERNIESCQYHLNLPWTKAYRVQLHSSRLGISTLFWRPAIIPIVPTPFQE
jgi:hypothetical protein